MSGTRAHLGDLTQAGIGDHEDQQRAREDRHDDAGNIHEPNPERDEAEHRALPTRHPMMLPLPAPDGNAAEDDHADDLELPALLIRRAGGTEPRREQHRGEPAGKQAGQQLQRTRYRGRSTAMPAKRLCRVDLAPIAKIASAPSARAMQEQHRTRSRAKSAANNASSDGDRPRQPHTLAEGRERPAGILLQHADRSEHLGVSGARGTASLVPMSGATMRIGTRP